MSQSTMTSMKRQARFGLAAAVLIGVMGWSLPRPALGDEMAPADDATVPTWTRPAELPAEVRDRILPQVAEEQGVPLSALRVVNLTAETWSDGCLGLGGPAELCLAALTPGWRVVITDGDSVWTYRTDATGETVRQERQPDIGQYTDIDGPYAADITEALSRGIMIGFPDEQLFHPEWSITREQLATVIVNAMQEAPLANPDPTISYRAELPAVPAQVETAPFTDVPASRWSAANIQYLKDLGLLQGYPDGSFRPEQAVTRAELMSLLLKMDTYLVELRGWDGRNSSNMSPVVEFSDVQDHWAGRYITIMSENCGAAEPLNGVGTQFAPDAPATRAYTAAAVVRDLRCLSLTDQATP
jgi:hypothetical protein